MTVLPVRIIGVESLEYNRTLRNSSSLTNHQEIWWKIVLKRCVLSNEYATSGPLLSIVVSQLGLLSPLFLIQMLHFRSCYAFLFPLAGCSELCVWLSSSGFKGM